MKRTVLVRTVECIYVSNSPFQPLAKAFAQVSPWMDTPRPNTRSTVGKMARGSASHAGESYEDTEYVVVDGVRHVRPYVYNFNTHAKVQLQCALLSLLTTCSVNNADRAS